jgi:simple sugar transport system permease protein
MRRALLAAAPSVVGLLIALAAGALVIAATGRPPHRVALHLLQAFSLMDVGETIQPTTVYIFTGLAVAYAFQAGLFNIGGEGQLVAGGFAMGIVGAALPAATPALVALPLCLACGFAAGAAWAAIPAILRSRLQVHEVITTILMNLIAAPVAAFLVNRYRVALRDAHPELREGMRTLDIVDGARVGRLTVFAGSHANTLIFVALAVAAVTWWAVHRTRTGFELRAVGHNPEAAHAAGISLPVTITKALLVSGGFAGLAAAPFVLAEKHYFEQGMGAGAGFAGIAVAVLAGNDPLRVIVSALLMALLSEGAEVVNGRGEGEVPREIGVIVTAVVIVSVLVAQRVARGMIQRAEARAAKGAKDGG